MSVDSRQGMEAEKNKIADTLVTAIVNFVTISLFTTSMDGRNISAISIAAAFAASIGSGRRKSGHSFSGSGTGESRRAESNSCVQQ